MTRLFPWWGPAGILIFCLGLVALIKDVEAWNTVWYVPAWYGYLLVVDAVTFRLRGHSFLSHRLRETGAMFFWSVPFWYLFEAYNFVIQNWYYVSGLHTDWAAILFGFVAFATVLPACFFHAELIRGLFEGMRWRPLQITGGVKAFMRGTGAACLVLPLVFPRYAFWMVWGATLGVPEVINYQNGAPSLLRDLEQGRPRRLLCLLAGGAWTGLIWEGLNYGARCKWIYTVPGLEDWKVFEMPILGFLGFPILALEAFAFYALLCHYVRAGRHPDRANAAGPVSRFRLSLAVLLALIFCGGVGYWGLELSLITRRPLLREVTELDARAIETLSEWGIRTPEVLIGRLEARGIAPLASEIGVEREKLEAIRDLSLMALHKGMGFGRARLLKGVGVRTVDELVSAQADELHAKLSPHLEKPLRLAEVKVWIRSARVHGHSHP